MSTGRIISSSAALVVLMCFFLPWITVSCGEEDIDSLSGYELTTGTEIDLGVGAEEVESDLIFLAVPLAALIAAGLIFGAWTGSIPGTTAAAGQVAAASITLIILSYKWLEARSDASEVGFVSFSPEYGLWGVVLGLIVIAVTAIISRSVGERAPPSDSAGPASSESG
jgi:hypothetical protein